jgi:hypothetical protein
MKKTDTSENHLPRIVLAISGLFFLIHGVILMQYSTLSPCVAAAKRIVDAKYDSTRKPTNTSEAIGTAIGRSMTEKYLFALVYGEVKQRPVTSCYSIALGFSEPQ